MIFFDFETRSHADLTKVGTWVYSQHPTTEVICAAYRIEDEPLQTWWPGKPIQDEQMQAWPGHLCNDSIHMPYDLWTAIHEGEPVEAWNVAFERSIWENVMVPEHGWFLPEDRQWRDAMAVASYYAMPQALDKCCRVLGIGAKDPEGTRLISKYSKLYLKNAQEDIPDEDFAKFVDYCTQDVAIEQAASDFLGDLPESELEVFFLDQEMNRRGIYLCRDSIRDAMAIVEVRAVELKEKFVSLTGGISPSQHEKVKTWMHDHGCPMENLQADYIEEVLDGKHDFTPEGDAARALDLRRQFNRASTKKLDAMLRNRPKDGRARYQTRYHGAFTGRWTGLGIQPLNMNRGFDGVPPDRLLRDIKHRSASWLDCMYGDAMEAVGKATRHHIKAERGNRIIAGDFTSIEAVVMACLSGEDWKVEAFRRKDPLYELMGCEIHRLNKEAVALAKQDKGAFKKKYPDERFDGKTGELAFQYQGNVGAWRKFDPEKTSKHTDERVKEICSAWREKHPAIVQFWADLERAALDCVTYHREEEVGTLSFKMIDGWLSMRLPNGKRIWYWKPEVRVAMPAWHKPEKYDPKDEDTWEWEACATNVCDCKPRPQLTYESQKEGQWRRVFTYGGKLSENACQSVSREILVPALFRLRDAGWPLILSVYDEAVSERKKGEGTLEEYKELLLVRESWFEDYPIHAEVWEGPVYRK